MQLAVNRKWGVVPDEEVPLSAATVATDIYMYLHELGNRAFHLNKLPHKRQQYYPKYAKYPQVSER